MANGSELSGQIRRGIAWVGVASGVVGALDAVTTAICLWLWVSPAELGTATIASALFPVLERLAMLGLGAAAVRGASDRRTLSSIMWLAIAASLGVLGLTVSTAWLVGAVFSPVVGSLLIAYAVKLVVQNAYLIPEALLRKELAFRSLAIVRIASIFAGSLAKLAAAYIGAHSIPELRVWCFVIGPLATTAVTLVGLWLHRPWWPSLELDLRAARAALRFGVQVSLGELLYFLYTSADYLVIGRVFGDAAVGAYRLAYELVLDVVRLISMVTGEVAFAAFARFAGEREAAGALLVRFTRQNLLAIAPLLIVIGVCADDLLALLYPALGAARVPMAATAARILCIVGALRAASFVLPPMLAGLGYARDALLYQILAAIALPVAFVVAATGWSDHGYLAVAWAWALAYPLAFAFVLAFALVRTGVPFARYLRGIAPVGLCLLAGGSAALGARLAMPALALPRVLVVAVATVVVYGALARLLSLRALRPGAALRVSEEDRT